MTETMGDTPDVAYEPSEELKAARVAMDEAKATAEAMIKAAQERLHKAIAADAAIETNNIVDIAKWMDWSSRYVSRIARAQGVKARVDVEPPRRRKQTDGISTDPSHG